MSLLRYVLNTFLAWFVGYTLPVVYLPYLAGQRPFDTVEVVISSQLTVLIAVVWDVRLRVGVK